MHLSARHFGVFALLCAFGLLGLAGCGHPDDVNIKLRKEIQDLQSRIEQLKKDKEADAARIAGFEQQVGTLPTLPQDRLAKMFTAHGLRLGPLTGGADLDPNKRGDEGLKVYVEPIDETEDNLKAAGSFKIEAFDLALPQNQRIGEWTSTPEQSKSAWHQLWSFRYFIFTCPWQTVPAHPEITIQVTFRDELTGRVFTAQKVAIVKLPGTAPASATSRP